MKILSLLDQASFLVFSAWLIQRCEIQMSVKLGWRLVHGGVVTVTGLGAHKLDIFSSIMA